MDILNTLGLNQTFWAQIINFLLLLLILRLFMYKPLKKSISERQSKISKSLKQADEIEVRLQKIDENEQERIAATQKKIDGMLQQAENDAQKKADQVIVTAKHRGEQMMTEFDQQLKQQQTEFDNKMEDYVYETAQAVVKKVISEDVQLKKESVAKVIKQLDE